MRGRNRDPGIDARVLAAARRQLSRHGYEAMSVSAVAAEAGTTRQALYRRWNTKAALAEAAIGTLAEGLVSDTGRGDTGPDAFADLVRELSDFQQGVSREGRLSLVGTMLQDTTDPDARARYRRCVVRPRRERLRRILGRALTDGLLDADADLEVALTMATGSWYGRALAGAEVPPDWPYRVAALLWRSLGGEPPPPAS